MPEAKPARAYAGDDLTAKPAVAGCADMGAIMELEAASKAASDGPLSTNRLPPLGVGTSVP